jgi:hypothetical protein
MCDKMLIRGYYIYWIPAETLVSPCKLIMLIMSVQHRIS